jgi:hypothetical protein
MSARLTFLESSPRSIKSLSNRLIVISLRIVGHGACTDTMAEPPRSTPGDLSVGAFRGDVLDCRLAKAEFLTIVFCSTTRYL